MWIHHQYLADKDEERFLDSIWTVAKVCRDTEQIGVLIDGVKKEVSVFCSPRKYIAIYTLILNIKSYGFYISVWRTILKF